MYFTALYHAWPILRGRWTLGFCPLLGWLVATESALKPRAYLASGPFSLRSLTISKEKWVETVRSLSSAWLSWSAFSALPLDSSRRDTAWFSTRTLSRIVPVTFPYAPVLNIVCCLCLQLAQLRLVVLSYYSITCHVLTWYVNTWYAITLTDVLSPNIRHAITWQGSLLWYDLLPD